MVPGPPCRQARSCSHLGQTIVARGLCFGPVLNQGVTHELTDRQHRDVEGDPCSVRGGANERHPSVPSTMRKGMHVINCLRPLYTACAGTGHLTRVDAHLVHDAITRTEYNAGVSGAQCC